MATFGSDLTTGAPTVNGVPFGGYSGFKNYIINGGFDVWQRGTTGSGNGYVSADRWNLNTYTSGTISLTKKTDATSMPFTTYARFQQSVVGTSSGLQALQQRIETLNLSSGTTVTLSFYARANSTITTTAVRGLDNTSKQFTVTTQWQKFTFTGVIDYVTSSYTSINIDTAAENTLWYLDIAQVQLEKGSVATPFENRPYGLELSLCQRYYEIGVITTASVGSMFTGGYYMPGSNFKVTKRTTSPTVTIYSSASGSLPAGTSGSLTNLNSTGSLYAVSVNYSVIPFDTGFNLRAETTIGANTPLAGTYTASAEL